MGRRKNGAYNRMVNAWNNGMPTDTLFGESLYDNNVTFIYYFQRILDLAISEFEWVN